jgi:thiol-disulfide isomerase/thioredoxin
MSAPAGHYLMIPCGFLGLLFLFASAGFSPGCAESARAPFSQDSLSRVDAAGLSALIASNKGAVVAVNIFASWCPPCREEVPDLIKVHNHFSGEDFLLLGVSVDKEPKALVVFLNNLKVNYPVLLAEGDFTVKMKVTAVPRLLLYNKKGELVMDHKGSVSEKDLSKAVSHLLTE